jgi:ABC-type nitrate/sulfonate/bicarbonate transport system ATPase subunit
MNSYTYKDVLLKLDNISLVLDNVTIIKNVNIEVKDIVRPNTIQGQVIGFLGPSGLGKTQLFRIISGLIKPTTGQVLIGVEQVPVTPGRVGVVQQNYPLFNHRTVISNLRVAARACNACDNKKNCPKCAKGVDYRVQEMLDRIGLEAHRDKYPAQLSGGQRQRVAIAQQLLCSETFLLLDEPFSGLDPIMVDQVSKLLAELANQKDHNTIIVVSHDIAAIAAIADHIWVLGRDYKDGVPLPGAYIKHNFNLVDLDLAWHKDIQHEIRFQNFVREIRTLFTSL